MGGRNDVTTTGKERRIRGGGSEGMIGVWEADKRQELGRQLVNETRQEWR